MELQSVKLPWLRSRYDAGVRASRLPESTIHTLLYACIQLRILQSPFVLTVVDRNVFHLDILILAHAVHFLFLPGALNVLFRHKILNV